MSPRLQRSLELLEARSDAQRKAIFAKLKKKRMGVPEVKPSGPRLEVLNFTKESEAEKAWSSWSKPFGSTQLRNELEYNKDGTFTVRREWK